MISTAPLAIPVSYLLGSIPSAYIAGRLVKHVDIRDVGDGNMGAANTFREVGFIPGLVVSLVDVGKGISAVLLARGLGLPDILVFIAGVAAVLGHDYPIFLQFRGGRGASTAIGVLLALMPRETLILAGIAAIPFVLTINFTVVIGIMLGALFLLAWYFQEPTSLVVYAVVLPVLVGVRDVLTAGKAKIPEARKRSPLAPLVHYLVQRWEQGNPLPDRTKESHKDDGRPNNKTGT